MAWLQTGGNKNEILRFVGWGAVAFLLCASAAAQSVPPAPIKAQNRVGHLSPAQDPSQNLDRIIIGFRPEAARASAAGSPVGAADMVKTLNLSARLSAGMAEKVELAYHRSVSSRTHVALTSRRMNRAELFALTRRLEQDPSVAYAELDERVTAQFVPNDADFASRQWTMQSASRVTGAANLPAAWDIATGAGVVIALLDGGYLPHVDVFANILAGYDFVSGDPSGAFTTANDGDGRDGDARDPGDWSVAGACVHSHSSWHGTHVAGILAAVGNNAAGVIGAAFNAKLLPVRVLGVCGGFVSDIAAGMRWSVGLAVPGVPANSQIAKVLNMSLGRAGNCSTTFKEAVDEVRASGSVIIAATGNEGASLILQPANCPGVIGVTAHTIDGDNADYANIGAGTSISAPGGGRGVAVPGDGSLVYSTGNTGLTTPGLDSYLYKNGTSMATAHVSGVAALMFQVKPAITPDELRSRLVNAARPHPAFSHCATLHTCGAGLLDAAVAVGQVLADNAPVVSARYAPAGVAAHGTRVDLLGSPVAGRNGLGLQSVLWTQIFGPPVSLSGAGTNAASFVVPAVGTSFGFRFTAWDANGLSGSSEIVVPANNSAPQMAPIGPLVVILGARLDFTASATDAEGDAVVFIADHVPPGATFNAATGAFVWAEARPAGRFIMEITPVDDQLSGETQYVDITVAAPGSGGGGALGWPDLAALAGLALLAGLHGWRKRHGPRAARP